MTLVSALLLPLLYTFFGLFAARLASARVQGHRLAPVIGIFSLGWVLLVQLFSPLAATLLFAALAALNAGALIFKRQLLASLKADLAHFYLPYGVFLFAAFLYPMPGVYLWQTDWLDTLRQSTLAFSPESLSLGILGGRNPVYALSSAPAVLFLPAIESIQIHSAITVAAVLYSLPYCFALIFQKKLDERAILIFGLSSFAVLHALTMWSKFLAGGLVLLAFAESVHYRRSGERSSLYSGALLFGGAVTVHHASILYAPLIFWTAALREDRRSVFFDAAVFLVAGLLVDGLYEIGIMERFGAIARIGSNPAIAVRSATDGVTAFSLNAISALTGWAPLVQWDFVRMWAEGKVALSGAALFILRTSVAALAGTLLGIFLVPLVFSLRAIRRLAAESGGLKPAVFHTVLIIALQSALSPYPSFGGTAQLALCGLSLIGMLYVFYAWQSAPNPPRKKVLAWAFFLTGLAPIAVINAALLGAVKEIGPLARSKPSVMGSFYDWKVVAENHLTTLGLGAQSILFAVIIALCLALAACRCRS